MNKEQKASIIKMRSDGMTFSEIANQLQLSINTVKSFYRRNAKTKSQFEACMHCGKPIVQTKHKRQKKFCSDKCRMSWWSRNRDKMNHKNLEERSCKACGSLFSVASSSNRKYCSHACYIIFRFGGGSNEAV